MDIEKEERTRCGALSTLKLGCVLQAWKGLRSWDSTECAGRKHQRQFFSFTHFAFKVDFALGYELHFPTSFQVWYLLKMR